MSYKAKLTFKFDSEWEMTGSIFDDESLPEQHLTLEFPVEDCNTTQIFQAFANFMMAMGHTELSIMKGACSVAFNEMRSEENMKKVASEYDLIMAEELPEILEDRLEIDRKWNEQNQPDIDELQKRYWEFKKNANAEIRDLKAKLSRLQNPDNPNYTEEEMDAMSYAAEEQNKFNLLKKLKNAVTVCHDCGNQYGDYSVGCSSTWQGKCGVCGQEKSVTETRDYGYLRKGISGLLKDE